LNLYTF
jgi:cyclin-dependent kinase-like